MYIQVVETWKTERRKHHFDRLLDTLWSLGFTIKVPNPVRLMVTILEKKGFAVIDEPNPTSSTLQVVMVKGPPLQQA
jgi:hypothetical protein